MADNFSWVDVSLLFWSVFLGLLVGFSVFTSEPEPETETDSVQVTSSTITETETDSVQATSSIVTEVKLKQTRGCFV